MRAATTTSDARSSQQALAFFWPSISIMATQDVILLLLPVRFHDREHKQVIPAPTSPRTLSKQLYYVSSKSDVPFVTFQCVQKQQLVMTPAPTGLNGPRTLSTQLYYGSSKSDVPSVTLPCVQQQQVVMMPAPTAAPTSPSSGQPGTLLSKQLYYCSTRYDSLSVPSQLTKS
jgi:hypothetical protein